MKVRVEITKGPDLGGQFLLNQDEKMVIGRGGDTRIQMKDGLISREHCELKCDGKRLLIQDLGSTNHTFVQKNLAEPIPPYTVYEIADGGSFFVGPESRFTVTHVVEPQDQGRPVAPAQPPKITGGNFSASIDSPRAIHDVGDSSIFNLLGPVSTSPGLGDGGRVAPPPVSRPTPPMTGHDAGDYDSPVPAGYTGSIAPPNSQGKDEVIRPQIGDDAFADDAYLKSTPKIEDTPPENPSSTGNPPTVRDSMNATASTPESNQDVPPPLQGADDSTFSQSIAHPESIAIPGTFYARNDTPSAGVASVGGQVTSVGGQPPNPFDSSVVAPGKAMTQNPVQVADQDAAPAANAGSRSRDNGLYFHTGDDVGQLPGVVDELCQNLVPIYCIDLARIEPALDIASGSPQASPGKGPDAGVDQGSGGLSNFEDEPGSGNVSAFELDDEPSGESVAVGPSSRGGQIVGQPIYDFLPEGMQHQGPVLMTADEFGYSLEQAWHHDAVVVFFGQDADAMLAHLKSLVHINIQNGKTFKGMFGYCWPGVLHTTFEGQGNTQVARIFGESIMCVLLEDPQERHAWNLVSMRDMSGEVNALPQQ